MPTLERLAASLAVTAAIVAPAAGVLLQDPVCPDDGGSAVRRFVGRLERAGAFATQSDGATATAGDCPVAPVVPPAYLSPPGVMAPVVSSPPPPDVTPHDRMTPGGVVPRVRPEPPPPEHSLRRAGARRSVNPNTTPTF